MKKWDRYPYTEEEIKKLVAKNDAKVVGYNIYKAPKTPTEDGEYYCKTPLWEQAKNIANTSCDNGKILFITVVCDNGKEYHIW